MNRFSVFMAGFAALLIGGLAHGNTVDTIKIDNPLDLNPSGEAVVSFESGAGVQGFYDEFYGTDGYQFFDGVVLSDELSTAWFFKAPTPPPNDLDSQVAFLQGMVDKIDDPRLGDVNINPLKFEQAGTTFTTNREYFWIKKGEWLAFFWNPNLESIQIVTNGYSYYAVAGVPIPAAFVLFGSGLVGLGWLARRQRARKDSVG